MILFIFAISFVSYLTWCFLTLWYNIGVAQSLKVPYIVLLIDHSNVLWMIFEPLVFLIIGPFLSKSSTLARYGRRGWHYTDKHRAHSEMGPVWTMVTPCRLYVFVADPSGINEIFSRNADFGRPSFLYGFLGAFGPNLMTVDHTNWQRQRRVLTAAMSEHIHRAVWSESCRKAGQLVDSLIQESQCLASYLLQDVRRLSLDILTAASVRKSHTSTLIGKDYQDRLREDEYWLALQIVLDNFIWVAVFSSRVLLLPLLPSRLRAIGTATDDLSRYMMIMLEDELALTKQEASSTLTILGSFAKALQACPSHERLRSPGQSAKYLRLNELLGNLFLINLGGQGTIANSLFFTTLMLAAHPKIQEWVAEEVNEVMQDCDVASCNHTDIFPRLKRCQAILLETLRLYPPIQALAKTTGAVPEKIKLGNGRTVTIPSNTLVLPSLLAVQTLPHVWGEDSLLWRPQRWITVKGSGTTAASAKAAVLDAEELLVPEKGSYCPWTAGPQICPGKRFAQIEAAAFFTRLLQHSRVRVQPQADESAEQAQRKILDIVEDCEHALHPSVRYPERIKLVWEEVPRGR